MTTSLFGTGWRTAILFALLGLLVGCGAEAPRPVADGSASAEAPATGDATLAELAAAHGIQIPEFELPAATRGSRRQPDAILLWPKGDIRLDGLRSFSVEVSEEFDEKATLEFRRGRDVLYSQEFEPETLTTVSVIPLEVIEQIAVGDRITWGLRFESRRKPLTAQVKVIRHPKAENKIEKILDDPRVQAKGAVASRLLVAQVLQNYRLYSEALVGYLELAEDQPTLSEPYRGVVTTLRRLDDEDSRLWAIASQFVGGGGRMSVSTAGASSAIGGGAGGGGGGSGGLPAGSTGNRSGSAPTALPSVRIPVGPMAAPVVAKSGDNATGFHRNDGTPAPDLTRPTTAGEDGEDGATNDDPATIPGQGEPSNGKTPPSTDPRAQELQQRIDKLTQQVDDARTARDDALQHVEDARGALEAAQQSETEASLAIETANQQLQAAEDAFAEDPSPENQQALEEARTEQAAAEKTLQQRADEAAKARQEQEAAERAADEAVARTQRMESDLQKLRSQLAAMGIPSVPGGDKPLVKNGAPTADQLQHVADLQTKAEELETIAREARDQVETLRTELQEAQQAVDEGQEGAEEHYQETAEALAQAEQDIDAQNRAAADALKAWVEARRSLGIQD
jgi:hypothetical protein